MSKNRSPREVCSMTDGMMRFDGRFMMLLTAGGPEFRVGRLLFLFGSPKSLARLGELARNPLDLRGDAVERIAKPQVVAQRLEAAVLAEALDRRRGGVVVADDLRLLAHERLDVLVGDLEAELLGRRLEYELARDRAARLLVQPREQVLRRLAGHRQVRLERDTARLHLLREAAQQLARARFDERSRRIDVRCRDECVGDVGAELRLHLFRDLRSQAILDVLAQLRERLELAR